jgi:hypothetical protein
LGLAHVKDRTQKPIWIIYIYILYIWIEYKHQK